MYMLVCLEVHAVKCTKTFKQAYFQTQSPMFRIDNGVTYVGLELYLCFLFPVAVYMTQESNHPAVINQQSFAHIHDCNDTPFGRHFLEWSDYKQDMYNHACTLLQYYELVHIHL